MGSARVKRSVFAVRDSAQSTGQIRLGRAAGSSLSVRIRAGHSPMAPKLHRHPFSIEPMENRTQRLPNVSE